MKKIIFYLSLVLFSIIEIKAQNRIKFDYDTAGNQIVRRVCLNCNEFRTSDKEITKLKDEDLLKFSENDVISYYPNPVSEELYLKWELINNNKVSNIEIFSMNGQLIKSLNNLSKENSKTISFEEYTSGTYLILMLYTNGEKKSITIIKK